MKFLIFLSLALAVQRTPADDEGRMILFNGFHRQKIVLKTKLDRPYSLALDSYKGMLYFSYSLKRQEDLFRTARINIVTKKYYEIEDVENGFAQTIDEENHLAYIGGSKGIYTFDHKTTKVRQFVASKLDIWDIYYRNNVLYYSDFPAQFLYTIINGKITRFKDLDGIEVEHFVMDDDNVMFYSNATGLYSQLANSENGTKDAFLYKELGNDTHVRGLAIDRGVPFACFQDGLYKIKKETGVLEKELDVDDAFGMAFGSMGNVVYSNATSVIYLLMS